MKMDKLLTSTFLFNFGSPAYLEAAVKLPLKGTLALSVAFSGRQLQVCSCPPPACAVLTASLARIKWEGPQVALRLVYATCKQRREVSLEEGRGESLRICLPPGWLLHRP